MQLHIVHWNTDLYSSVTEAMSSSNGLAVIAVFIEVGVVVRMFYLSIYSYVYIESLPHES